MTQSIAEANGTASAARVTDSKPKASKKPRAAKRGATVAPAKIELAMKGKAAKKAPKGRVKLDLAKPTVARKGSKTATILDLLKRPSGATLKDVMKATGWLPHSVRGFLSGTVGKKMGLTLTSTKGDEGERIYSVEA